MVRFYVAQAELHPCNSLLPPITLLLETAEAPENLLLGIGDLANTVSAKAHSIAYLKQWSGSCVSSLTQERAIFPQLHSIASLLKQSQFHRNSKVKKTPCKYISNILRIGNAH